MYHASVFLFVYFGECFLLFFCLFVFTYLFVCLFIERPVNPLRTIPVILVTVTVFAKAELPDSTSVCDVLVFSWVRPQQL